jgi:outer membrane receptor protein involved in Fe transport
VRVERGTRLAGLPRHTLKLGMELNLMPSLTVAADAQALSRLPAQGSEDGVESAHGHALLNLRATWQPAARWEWSVRVNNALDRRYESYAAVATDMFPNGRLASSREDAETARFVAPGAPRSITANLRYTF